MVKILFICHGNICRSPMAEFIFKDLVRQAGLERRFEIASAASFFITNSAMGDRQILPWQINRIFTISCFSFANRDLSRNFNGCAAFSGWRKPRLSQLIVARRGAKK